MNYKLLYIIFIAAAMCGCTQNNSQSADEDNSSDSSQPAVSPVSLTAGQVNSLGITVDTIRQHCFKGITEANGTLALLPQSEALVSTFIGANVIDVSIKEGQRVKRSQILARLSHPGLLDLQSSYLTAYNRMKFISQEYERQKQLYSQNISSGKEFQQTESDYNSLKAELAVAHTQLTLIGINPESLQEGKMFSSVSVKSPIDGTVEKIYVKTGQYADSQTPMFSVVNTDNVYADLLVFEKDINAVKPGQRVKLSLRSSTGKELTGKIYSVGASFDGTTRAVHVRADIEGVKSGLIAGMYLCGKIETDSRNLCAIPEDGVIDNMGKWYIFSVENHGDNISFLPVEIKKGITEDGFVEIINYQDIKADKVYALNNAYYIFSEMKKNETGEE